jgi:hypothetical protein
MNDNAVEIKEKILKGLELYYERLIQSKTEKNQKLVISINGKVVKVDAAKYRH